MGFGAFLLLLSAYNNVANRWSRFNGPLFVPLNACATAIVVIAGLTAFGLTRDEIGLRFVAGDALFGLGLGLALVGLLALGLIVPAGRRRLADERVSHLRGSALLYQMLVRIPIGTALFEEVAFRGVAFAGLRHLGVLEAALISSAAFGIWHIAPTVNLVEANQRDADPGDKIKAVIGAVLFTFCAGLLLCRLRIETGNLSTVVLLHATVNAGATLVSVGAARLLRKDHSLEGATSRRT
jgi:membrane protease YdiL (CAAX protease family)